MNNMRNGELEYQRGMKRANTEEEAEELCQMMDERDGCKIITFKKFKKYQDQKQLSKVEWCTDGSLPDKSGEYLVITEDGALTVLTYSRVHRLFNVADAFSAEVADRYAIEVKAWISVDKLNVPQHMLPL